MIPGVPQLPKVIQNFIAFVGGLDIVTPVLRAKPGSLKYSKNVEIGINGGYSTIQGYEAFDGRPAPSDAVYYVLPVTFFYTPADLVGVTLTDEITSGTLVVIAVEQASLIATKVTGTISVEGGLFAFGKQQVRIGGKLVLNGASSPLLHAQYKNLAADEYRKDIVAVPGQGDVLGIRRLGGVTYAWRAVSDFFVQLYKSTSSGWVLVPLGEELAFTSGGTTEIVEGDTITGSISGAEAVVTRVVLESGSWSAGDAAGRFIFASHTGTFQAENIDVGASLNLATISGISSNIVIDAGGRFEFVNHNFGGLAGEERIYGCDGVNRCFEFDGSVFVPISTSLPVDAPTHIAAFKNHLFISFDGSAQHSGISTPYIFSPIFGAEELATGDTITGFQTEPSSDGDGALVIYSRNSANVLYGTSVADWILVKYRDEVGAIPYTIQQLGITMFMDDRGITNLQTTQAYGNFKHSIFSRLIQPYINSKKSLVSASAISREKDQYRLFFSDKEGIYITVEGTKILGATTIRLRHPALCTLSQEDSDGTEVIMFGSDDGFVYQMDKGTSFDGQDIEWALRLHFISFGSPRVIKKYKNCVLEIDGDGYSQVRFSYDLGYGSPKIPQGGSETIDLNLSASHWDDYGKTWDDGFWDGKSLSVSRFKISGSSENISILLSGKGDYFSPITISGALIRYTQRRQLR